MVEAFKIIRTKKSVQVRFNADKLLIDSNLYQFKQYVKGHYFDNDNTRILKDGYSFGATKSGISLDDWFNEFTEASKILTKSSKLLF